MSLPPIDKNWERWIQASIYKFIEDQNTALAVPYKLYREGEQRKTSAGPDSFWEVRMDGPRFKYRASDYRVEVDVNILLQLQVDRDLYHPNKMSADACVILNNDIAMYKLGNIPAVDDASLVACLRVDQDVGIQAHKYGIIEPKLPVIQASVSTKYWVDLPA